MAGSGRLSAEVDTRGGVLPIVDLTMNVPPVGSCSDAVRLILKTLGETDSTIAMLFAVAEAQLAEVALERLVKERGLDRNEALAIVLYCADLEQVGGDPAHNVWRAANVLLRSRNVA